MPPCCQCICQWPDGCCQTQLWPIDTLSIFADQDSASQMPWPAARTPPIHSTFRSLSPEKLQAANQASLPKSLRSMGVVTPPSKKNKKTHRTPSLPWRNYPLQVLPYLSWPLRKRPSHKTHRQQRHLPKSLQSWQLVSAKNRDQRTSLTEAPTVSANQSISPQHCIMI